MLITQSASSQAAQRYVARYRQARFATRVRPEQAHAADQSNVSAKLTVAPSVTALGDYQWITERHREQFRTFGYMVIRKVVPEDITRRAVGEIAAFVGADLADRATWYRAPPELDGIVPMHHAQSQWDIRQCPNLYQVFTEFFATGRLMVDINRCIFRPPVNPLIPEISHGTIHWDTNPREPGAGSVQAVVLLTDVTRDGGGFQCVPEVYQNLEAWLAIHARHDDFDFGNPGLKHWNTTQVEGHTGDVILWSTKLPHGSAANLSDRPRIAAFVSMQPPPSNPEPREGLKSWWLTKRAPDYWRGLPGQRDPEPGSPATLSELGEKLIGVVPW
ncbi:MAG: phytanoyl-CoA dioxygenase family protein [Bryobacteraceae bacterium]|jgi:hypothetical protein